MMKKIEMKCVWGGGGIEYQILQFNTNHVSRLLHCNAINTGYGLHAKLQDSLAGLLLATTASLLILFFFVK